MIARGFKPHPDQREKIDLLENPEVKYVVLTTGRQWGKTLLAENLILKWSVEKRRSVNMWVSPVYSQSKKAFEDIVDALRDTPILKSYNKTDFNIELINGSKILFRSAERYDNLRGNTLDTLVVDEAAFVRDEVWNTILKPTVLVKGKKVLFISTPKGKNYLYELYLRGLDPEQKQYITLRGTSYDTPFITKEEVDEAKSSLPEDIFKQEILGEFVDNGGEVFGDIRNYLTTPIWDKPQQGEKYFAGLDFGRQNDYTVLTIFNSSGRIVMMYRERLKPWGEIISDITKLLIEYNAFCVVEVNSIGDVLYEQLQKGYKNLHPFVTTNSSKQNIIEDIIYGLNERQITIPTETLFPPLTNELKIFTFTYSPKTRKVTYGAVTGGHDDTIMSMALGYSSLKSKKTKGEYYIM